MHPTNDHRTEDHGSLDCAFRALSRAPRRRVLSALAERGSRDGVPFRVEDLVPDSRDRDAALVGLHHNHLPHLAAAGYVDWDREAGTVAQGPAFEEISPLLDLLEEHPKALPEAWP